ncbi:oligosaccharide flippase family protein [Citreimonas salinaria]|nr:oligosaccharide flippase family protein [Citreimonas salinaria]
MAIRVASVGMGFLVSVILTRTLGVDDFGRFAFALSIATIFALPLTGGLPVLLIREIAAARARKHDARRVVRWGYRFLATVAAALVLLALLGGILLVQLDVWTPTRTEILLAVLVVLLIPVTGLLQLQRSILSGHGDVVAGALGEQVFRPVTMLILLVLLLPMLNHGAPGALFLQVVAALLAVGGTVVLIRRLVPRSVDGPAVMQHGEWLRALVPLTALTAVGLIKSNTDILMLGILREPAEVGVYRIAVQVAVLSSFTMLVLGEVSAPRLAAAYAEGDRATLAAYMAKAARIMLLAAVTFVVLFALFGHGALVIVFGEPYGAAFYPCLILALGTLFSAACGLVGKMLQMSKLAGLAARSAAIAAVTNVVLNLVLVPRYGPTGAAIATAIAMVTMELQQWILVRRRLNLRADAFQRLS